MVKSILIVLNFMVLFGIVKNQIAFPEASGQRLDSVEMAGRVPLYAPDKCPENQLLYPGDQKADWICDCGPAFIYFPSTDTCYPAYRRGPCKAGDHLILKKGKVVPECDRNPCQEGFAKFNGKCYELGKPNGPCAPIEHGGGIFDVNATTLAVECLKGTDRLSLFKMPKRCAPGSKSDSNGNCRQIYNK